MSTADAASVDGQDRPIPFGVSAETGRPLPGLSDATLSGLEQIEAGRSEEHALAAQKGLAHADFGVTDVDDANNLGETGWGIVFAETAAPDVELALAPLLEHRSGAPRSSRTCARRRAGRPSGRRP